MNILKLLIYFYTISWLSDALSQIPSNIYHSNQTYDFHWEELWADEFNGANYTSPNSNYWFVQVCNDGWAGPCVYRPVDDCPGIPWRLWFMPVYLESNVYLYDGAVVFRTKKEYTNDNPWWVYNYGYLSNDGFLCPPWAQQEYHCNWQSQNPNFRYLYSSASMRTQPAYDLKYGYLEARIKVSDEQGLWPAFWTYWSEWQIDPNTGISEMKFSEEIDIFEFVPGTKEEKHPSYMGIRHNNSTMTTNLHTFVQGMSTPGQNCQPNCGSTAQFGINSVDDYTQWHTYAIEWSPEKIIYYVDGLAVRNSSTAHGFKIISELHQIILGTGLNPSVMTHEISLPAYKYVDYVRVYKLRNDCNTVISNCLYDWAHDNLVKKSITIGGQGCVNAVPPHPNNGTRVLRASEFIQISGDFSAPLGTSLYLDVSRCH